MSSKLIVKGRIDYLERFSLADTILRCYIMLAKSRKRGWCGAKSEPAGTKENSK
jgi:hypothetical protein